MKKKQKKSYTNILDTAGEQPPGEDFFVFTVKIDDPTNPNWDYAQSFMGSWEQAKAMAGALVNAWCGSKKRIGKGLQVAMYQGDGARKHLLSSMLEEARYRQEVRSN